MNWWKDAYITDAAFKNISTTKKIYMYVFVCHMFKAQSNFYIIIFKGLESAAMFFVLLWCMLK